MAAWVGLWLPAPPPRPAVGGVHQLPIPSAAPQRLLAQPLPALSQRPTVMLERSAENVLVHSSEASSSQRGDSSPLAERTKPLGHQRSAQLQKHRHTGTQSRGLEHERRGKGVQIDGRATIAQCPKPLQERLEQIRARIDAVNAVGAASSRAEELAADAIWQYQTCKVGITEWQPPPSCVHFVSNDAAKAAVTKTRIWLGERPAEGSAHVIRGLLRCGIQ